MTDKNGKMIFIALLIDLYNLADKLNPEFNCFVNSVMKCNSLTYGEAIWIITSEKLTTI